MAPIKSNLEAHLRRDRSITQFLLENVCNTDPDKVICEDTLTSHQATYGGIRESAFRCAESLRSRSGLREGDIVSIIGRSCVDYILAIHAVWAAGGVVSTINHANTAEEIAFAIKVIEPSMFIVDASVKDQLEKALKLAGRDRQRTAIATLLNREADLPRFPDDFLGEARISPMAYTLDGQDAHTKCAAIVLSSGTTGLPKAVMLSHHNLIAICEMLRLHNTDNWRGDMREVFFPGGYSPGGRCEQADVLKLLQDKRATLARLVPTVAAALATSSAVSTYRYPDLECFSCAGAVLKPTVAANLRERFPGVSLCQTYGCTETSSCISQSGVRDINAPPVATGTLLANIKIRFVNEQLQDVETGEPGEICVSAPTVMMGYKNNAQATAESMLLDPGWYRTGDIGYLDQAGCLIIVDRIKDVIKYKGQVVCFHIRAVPQPLSIWKVFANNTVSPAHRFQVSPTEIEELIGTHPLVKDVGVAATWDDVESTELVRAYVVAHDSVRRRDGGLETLAEDVKALVAEKAAGYKKIRGGVVFVSSLPRNPTGKLLRRMLKLLDEKSGEVVRAKI